MRTGSTSSDEEVVDFLANSCGCTKRFNGSCSRGLTAEIVTDYRLAITELDSSELDLAILAQLHAGMTMVSCLPIQGGLLIRQRVTFQYAFKGNLFAGKCSFSSQDK